jgi:hypothetical protein
MTAGARSTNQTKKKKWKQTKTFFLHLFRTDCKTRTKTKPSQGTKKYTVGLRAVRQSAERNFYETSKDLLGAMPALRRWFGAFVAFLFYKEDDKLTVLLSL